MSVTDDSGCVCGKPIWGEGYDPKTGRRFYSHVDDNLEKHADGTWVVPVTDNSGESRKCECHKHFQQVCDICQSRQMTRPVPCPGCGCPIFVRENRTIVAHRNRLGGRCNLNETLADDDLYHAQFRDTVPASGESVAIPDAQGAPMPVLTSINYGTQRAHLAQYFYDGSRLRKQIISWGRVVVTHTSDGHTVEYFPEATHDTAS